MKRKLSPKRMILDISSMSTRAKKLLNLDPIYSSLLKYLTNTNYYYHDNVKIPTIKELAIAVDIPYGTVRKHLNKIYDDLCSQDPNLDFPFEFNQLEIIMYMKGYYKSRTISLKQLPIIPRIGETVEIPFFSEFTGTNYYHVADIYHHLMDDKQQIFISLKTGCYDSYFKIRKDQAITTGEISVYDEVTKDDDEIKKLLALRPGKAW